MNRQEKLQLATPDSAEAVFYEAFMHCDTAVMAALWADGEVICVHPGSAAIAGHAAVCRSWATIFSNAERPDIKCTVIRQTVSGELAVHIVVQEMLNAGTLDAVVLATNVYRKFDVGWLMIEHHASLVQNHGGGKTLQ